MRIVEHLRRYFRDRDRRQHLRTDHPRLVMEMDGKRYTTMDWSLGGFRLERYHIELRPGDHIMGSVAFGSNPSGEFVAEMIGVGEDGSIGLRLMEISPAVFVAMAGLKGL